MKEVLVLRDLDCIKAIAHPRRVDILKTFNKEPLSAKQLSEILDEPHAKINYHIKTLYNVGILELVEEKIKSGIVEKYYYPTANNIVISRNVDAFVLGNPKNLDGSLSKRSEITLEFKKILEDRFKLNVIMQDERLSTVEAERMLISNDTKRKKRKKVIDKIAATIILQSFLDRRNHER